MVNKRDGKETRGRYRRELKVKTGYINENRCYGLKY
jgi:hypothetical protein